MGESELVSKWNKRRCKSLISFVRKFFWRHTVKPCYVELSEISEKTKMLFENFLEKMTFKRLHKQTGFPTHFYI